MFATMMALRKPVLAALAATCMMALGSAQGQPLPSGVAPPLIDEFVTSILALEKANLEHPEEGTIRALGIPVKLSDTPGGVRRPAPLLGQHTAEILREAGIE